MRSITRMRRTRIAIYGLAIAVALAGIDRLGTTRVEAAGPATARGMITTIAGTGIRGYSGNGKPAERARVAWPSSVATDIGGNVFVCEPDNQVVRRVDLVPETMRLIAGSHAEGYSGDGFAATNARLSFPGAVFVDSRRHVWISDSGNMRIRKVDAGTGDIRTVAGKSGRGFSGDGGPATSAFLDTPGALTVDDEGNLYFFDTNNNRIRRVDGRTGVIYTVVGTGEAGFNGDGGAARETQIRGVGGLALDEAGNLYFSDSGNDRVRRVDADTDIVTTVAGTGEGGFDGDGGLAIEAQLQNPQGIALDVDGSILVADRGNNRVRRVDAETGVITTVAGNGERGYSGDGGPAVDARLNEPNAVALDGAGVLYIADTLNHAIRAVPGIGAASEGIPRPVVTGASYEKPTLAIEGTGLFAFPGTVVRVNGRAILPRRATLGAERLDVEVGPKQLRLVPGDNEIVVVVAGVASEPYVLRK